MGYFRWTYHEGIVRFKIRRVPIEHSSGALLEATRARPVPSLSLHTDVHQVSRDTTEQIFPTFFCLNARAANHRVTPVGVS